MRLSAPRVPGPYGMEPPIRMDFLSSDEIRGQNIGTMPVINLPPVDKGITFNGVSQYARFYLSSYNTVWTGGVSGELSVYCEFWPTFAYTEATSRSMWDSEVASCAGQKDGTGPAFELRFGLGNYTTVCAVNCAVYGPLWQVNGRNRVVVAARSGANYAYMNGTAISSTATAWSRSYIPTILYVGAYPGSLLFSGTITDYRVFNRQLSTAECLEMTS